MGDTVAVGSAESAVAALKSATSGLRASLKETTDQLVDAQRQVRPCITTRLHTLLRWQLVR